VDRRRGFEFLSFICSEHPSREPAPFVAPALSIAKFLTQGTPLPAKAIVITIENGDPPDVCFRRILDQHGFIGLVY
jgi:hypothetical protein